MDQKNTIVKCKAHPNCLFNYNGVCDNYLINISADGKCECYVETEWLEQNKEYYDSCFYCQHALHEENNKWLYCEIDGLKIDRVLRSEQCKQFQSVYSRGQRAKCDLYEDVCDYEPFLTKAICSQCKHDTHGNLCSRKNIASNGIWTCWEAKNEV